jgi:hypothetical protein
MLDTPEPLQSRLVDMIIFDTAALDQGTDAYLLSALADATMLIVEAGKEHKDTLHQLSITFQRFGAPILGVMVNRQQEQHQSYFYAPYQVSTERKVVASPSPDQTALLPLTRKNSERISAMVNSEEKGEVSAKQSLTLKSLVDRKDVNRLYNKNAESDYINTKGLGDSDTIKNELPETPLPLLSVHPNIAADITNNQTAEAQEDAPGRSQFAPFLRFGRATTQRRANENASEV